MATACFWGRPVAINSLMLALMTLSDFPGSSGMVISKKVCAKCHSLIALSDFHKNRSSSDGLQSCCKLCSSLYSKAYYAKNGDYIRSRTKLSNKKLRSRRKMEDPEYNTRRALRVKYSMSLEDYQAMLSSQAGGCAICGASVSGRKNQERLIVDHCHSSGRVRGLLCHRHNIGLGSFRDSPEELRMAADYLERGNNYRASLLSVGEPQSSALQQLPPAADCTLAKASAARA